jgi:NAD(P)-dependent dehydrogenase (short-subunit alcohol dehydrogenase family)
VRFRGKVVVIMGGSRGLGLELARRWAAEGARVALCARTSDDVDRAVAELRRFGTDVFGQACDITRQEEVSQFLQEVDRRLGPVDVLVNNAGIIQVGPVECMTLDDYHAALATHFWGPLYATLAVLPSMRRRRAGRIVNIASIGGEISVPHLVPYSASKFALVGLSEGLHAELAKDGIQVTTVCPGLMRTGSPRNADFKGNHQAEYAWFSISDSLPGLSIGSERAARQIVEACRHGQAHLIVSLPAQLAIRFHGALPGVTNSFLALVNDLLPTSQPGGRQTQKGYESFSAVSPSWITTLTELAAKRNHEIRDNAQAT